MIVRARYLVAAAVGLCAAHLLPAQEPARLGLERNSLPAPRTANQQLADAVARQLRQGGRLRDYRIDIVCREASSSCPAVSLTRPSATRRSASARACPVWNASATG